jgi:hypothetical protein
MTLPRKTKKRTQHSRASGPLPDRRAPVIGTGFASPLTFALPSMWMLKCTCLLKPLFFILCPADSFLYQQSKQFCITAVLYLLHYTVLLHAATIKGHPQGFNSITLQMKTVTYVHTHIYIYIYIYIYIHTHTHTHIHTNTHIYIHTNRNQDPTTSTAQNRQFHNNHRPRSSSPHDTINISTFVKVITQYGTQQRGLNTDKLTTTNKQQKGGHYKCKEPTSWQPQQIQAHTIIANIYIIKQGHQYNKKRIKEKKIITRRSE